jgi:hypothetical protein
MAGRRSLSARFTCVCGVVLQLLLLAGTACGQEAAQEEPVDAGSWVLQLIAVGVVIGIIFFLVVRSRKAPAAPSPRATVAPAAASPPRQRKIFMSYRRDDSADVTGRIYDRLVQRFGKDQVFKDVDSIPLGVDFRRHLHQVVGSCDIVLAVMGERWLTAAGSEGKNRLQDEKDFVRIELEAALQRTIPVVPVLVRGAEIPREGDLPSSLAEIAYRNGIAVRADPDFHHDMDRLIEGVDQHLASLT